ncbi:MAG: hypothetical protein V6Z89_20070 [Desulfobacter sp.]
MKKQLFPNSIFGVVASIITIVVFFTGVSSLPSLLTLAAKSHFHSLSGFPCISYGIFYISQIAYLLCIFVITRFLFYKLINLLHIETFAGKLFCAGLFLLSGWAIAFGFAEAFWGPPSSWLVEYPKIVADSFTEPLFNTTFIFIAVIFTIKLALNEAVRTDS